MFIERIKIEKLKETVIQGHDKNFKIVIKQFKQSYKGLSMYRVLAVLKYDGELFDIVQSHVTHNRVKSDSCFFNLESRYPEENIISKIF